MKSVLSADKPPHTNKEEFIDIKSLHVMYYRPFDRSMGLRIINKVLKPIYTTTFLQPIGVIRLNSEFADENCFSLRKLPITFFVSY